MLSKVPNHRMRLFCAILVGILSAVAAGGQAVPSGALPAELRAHIKDQRFGLVTSIRGLPLGVRGALQTLFGGETLDMAERGDRFQEGERSVSTLPTRRLAAAACSYDYCLVYYERGGVRPTWRVALFRWTPEATKFEWGGVAPAGLTTIDQVKTAILSGAIKSSAGPW
jgi:hypothetical protein